MSKKLSIKWLSTSKDANYDAAISYLRLIYDPMKVLDLINRLKKEEIVEFQAKDILRASGLTLLDGTNKTVEKDLNKIKAGISLSPILLIRDLDHNKVVVADGFHRLVACYKFSENITMKCKIVSG